MTTAIIDYGSGNLRSAEKSFQRASNTVGGGRVFVTADPDSVRGAERVVLPGVGAFRDCRSGLHALDGMPQALEEHVAQGKPFFGICVGMQLMATIGTEFGETPGFDWISGTVERLQPDDRTLKIPHMGWNALSLESKHPCFADIDEGEHVYFVHSYHLKPENEAHRLAAAQHGQSVTAAVGHGSLFGTQFHPEKSQDVGQKIIGNFLRWSP